MPLKPHKPHLWNSPREQMIARHWENNFPKEAAELKRLGEFYSHVERAAERASLVEYEANLAGALPGGAQELALEEWGQCPDLRDSPQRVPPTPIRAASRATTGSPTTES